MEASFALPLSGVGVFAQQDAAGSAIFGGTPQYDASYEEQGLSRASASVPFFSSTRVRDGSHLESASGYDNYRGMGPIGGGGDDTADDASLRVLGGGGGYPKLGISSVGGSGGFSMLDTYSLESSMNAEIGESQLFTRVSLGAPYLKILIPSPF